MVRLPSCEGSGPDIELVPRPKKVNSDNPPMVEGIVPLRVLDGRESFTTLPVLVVALHVMPVQAVVLQGPIK